MLGLIKSSPRGGKEGRAKWIILSIPFCANLLITLFMTLNYLYKGDVFDINLVRLREINMIPGAPLKPEAPVPVHIDMYGKSSHPGGVTFFHIPKNGGFSFVKDVTDMCAPYRDRIKIDKNGRAEHCLEKHLHHGKFIIGFVRVPRDHVLSQYLECRDDTWGQKMTRNTLFPRYDPWQKAFEEWYRHFTYGDPKDPTVHHWTLPDTEFNCYNPRNHQVRTIFCRSPAHGSPGHYEKLYTPMYNHDSDGSLARGYREREADALARLPEIHGLGILELYTESICMFHYQLGIPPPTHCLPTAHTTDKLNVKETEVTHGVRKHDIHDFSESVHRDVDALTRSDVLMYVAALEKFCRNLQAYHLGNDFRSDQSLLSMDRLAHLKLRTGYIDELWKYGRKPIFDECFRGVH